jgi:hypothetical protein
MVAAQECFKSARRDWMQMGGENWAEWLQQLFFRCLKCRLLDALTTRDLNFVEDEVGGIDILEGIRSFLYNVFL